MNDIHIREARGADIEHIVRIASKAWRPIYEHRMREMGTELYGAFFPDCQSSKASELRVSFHSSKILFYVAEIAQRIVGFVSCHPDEASGTAEIGNNAVDPDFQGRGVAGIMYEHIFDCLRARGIHYVQLNPGDDPAHRPARRAYQKSGFQTHISSVRYFRKI